MPTRSPSLLAIGYSTVRLLSPVPVMSGLSLLLAVTAILCAFSGVTRAAEISLVECSGSSACPYVSFYSITPSKYELHLNGPIVTGDYENFRRKLSGTLTLVLNSPGGQLDEALRIIDLIVAPPEGVKIEGAYLPENAECYSACAFIFMHAGFGLRDALKMHYTARLGFHAVWLTNLQPNRTYTAQEIVDTFALSQQTIKELTKYGRIPLELLIEFLDKGPNELYLVDTAYKAAWLGIVVGGFYDPELYRKRVSWPINGWFGLVVPTKETAFWAVVGSLNFKIIDLLGWTWSGHDVWLGYINRPELPGSSREDSLIKSFAEWQAQLVQPVEWDVIKSELGVVRSPDEETDATYEKVEFVEFHSENKPAIIQFSSQGLRVRGEHEQWVPINYLLAFPPGLKLADIPALIRSVIVNED